LGYNKWSNEVFSLISCLLTFNMLYLHIKSASMKEVVLTLLTVISVFGYTQNNALVIRNDAYIVVNGGTAGSEAVFVVNQPHPNGIITSGTGGNIVSKGEFDYIKWNVGPTFAGNSFVIPFTTGTLGAGEAKIPLTIDISNAGVGSGYVAASTWEVGNGVGVGAYDNTPFPSDVVHMAGALGAADVSEYVVDRFWIIDTDDPLGTGDVFTTKPDPSFDFTYNTDPSETASGNILTLGNLGAQRYNAAADKWFGWFIGATAQSIWGADNALGMVSGASVSGSLWDRTWALADINNPLPVELSFFDGACEEQGIVLEWETISEINSDYFEVYSSLNGIDFTLLGQVAAIGNTNTTSNYEYIDENPSSQDTYYKLIQYDYDRQSNELPVIKTSPCNNSGNINVFNSSEGVITLEYTGIVDEDIDVILYDAKGKQLGTNYTFNTTKGFNTFNINYNNIAFGSYLVTIQTSSNLYAEKIVLN
jgi:hypothetical protein